MNLQAIANELDNIEYQPARFPGLIYHNKEPRCAIIFFNSGKLVFTGLKNMDAVNKAFNHVSKKLRDIGVDFSQQTDIEIQNIVASYELNKLLNLNSISITLGKEKAEYIPEKFEGLVYYADNTSISTILFRSGKILCSGARNIDDAREAINSLLSDLEATGLMT